MKSQKSSLVRVLTQITSLFSICLLITACNQGNQQLKSSTASASETPEFKGKMELDVRDSKADWTPYLPKKAPEGAPNILFILYDDTGLAAWSPYGGAINMPTLDKL